MTRAEIIEKNLRLLEEGIARIRKVLPRMVREGRDLQYSVVVYSRTALRGVRNIEIEVSGKSQREVDRFYKTGGWE